MSDQESSGVPVDESEPPASSVQETSAEKPIANDDDDELDALLDDALEGFDRPVVPQAQPAAAAAKAAEAGKSVEGDGKEVVWSEEFMKQASADFEKNIRMMMAQNGGEGAEFSENLFKVSQEAAAKVFENQSDDAFGASFAETLRFLAEGTESLQAEPDEEALAKMLEKMAFGGESGLGGGSGPDLGDLGGLGEILPAMQGMLQSLLSKDLLYPSIKEIVNKYPDWLADNRSKIDAAEYEKYNRQYAIMQQVCTEFESEAANDDDAVKSARFERILTLMQQMQECGHPPKELAGEAVNLPNPFGAAADLAQAGAGLPAGAENCVVM